MKIMALKLDTLAGIISATDGLREALGLLDSDRLSEPMVRKLLIDILADDAATGRAFRLAENLRSLVIHVRELRRTNLVGPPEES